MKILLSALLVASVVAHVQAQAPQPKTIKREAWGAVEPLTSVSKYSDYTKNGNPLEKPVYTTVILHNTAMGKGYGAAEARRIQNYQMVTAEPAARMSDIAYNFLIDSNGTIFDGRDLRYVPAHAGESREANTNKDITLDPDFAAIGIAFSNSTA